METTYIEKEIGVLYVQADLFPEGIMAAFEKIRSLIPPGAARRVFGISFMQEGKIIYRAGMEELYQGEASIFHVERFVVPAGRYISKLLHNWRSNETLIGSTFQQMLREPGIDPKGFCLEMYHDDGDVHCMVPLANK